MADEFTLTRECTGEFRTKSSRFYGRAYPVESPAAVKEHHHSLQEKFSDATHICYAYRLMTNSGVDEFSTDAGEPGGSAGRPILNVLRREHLINSIILVIRYFGGTKLGIPGLIEAYGTTAAETVANNPRKRWIPTVVYTLTYAYDQQRLVESVIRQLEGLIVNQSFTETIEIRIRLDSKKEPDFLSLLQEKSAGSLVPKKTH